MRVSYRVPAFGLICLCPSELQNEPIPLWISAFIYVLCCSNAVASYLGKFWPKDVFEVGCLVGLRVRWKRQLLDASVHNSASLDWSGIFRSYNDRRGSSCHQDTPAGCCSCLGSGCRPTSVGSCHRDNCSRTRNYCSMAAVSSRCCCCCSYHRYYRSRPWSLGNG